MMAIKADIWMPLYIGDYLADTAYLTTEQHGAYLLLIMAYWRNGPPPDNDAILASLTKMTPDAWSIARAVLGRYFIVGGGVWMHARIEREIEKAKKHRESAHEKAARAAAARWEKERERKMLGALPEALHGEMPQQCPSPSPSPLPKQVHKNTDQEIEQASSPPASPTAPPLQCVVDPVQPIPKPKPREAAAGTRLPADWALSQALGEWALTEGLTRERIRQEADRFRDYWIAKPGAAGRKTDWPATWRNWVRRATETKTGGTNGQSGRPDRESVSARAVREAAEFIADLDAAERLERDQADGGGGVYENELALPWEGIGGLPGAR